MTPKETVNQFEDFGRQRAAKSNDVSEAGGESPDSFVDEASGCSIHDPWKSSCGRFEVDPYKEYGREFVIWLLYGGLSNA